MKAFGIGSVLSTTFDVWRRNFLPFTIIAAVIYAPVLALRLTAPSISLELLLLPINTLNNALIASAITYTVIMELHGTRPSYAECFTRGLSYLGAALAVTLVSTLAVIGGLLLLVVPGLIVALMLYVVVPVAVTERLGVMASLRRSRELTEGRKGTLFWLVVIMSVLSFGLQSVLEDVLAGDAEPLVYFALDVTWGLASAVMAAVAYTLLRQDKEGVQVPQLAKAFARVRDTGT